VIAAANQLIDLIDASILLAFDLLAERRGGEYLKALGERRSPFATERRSIGMSKKVQALVWKIRAQWLAKRQLARASPCRAKFRALVSGSASV
jgi:hypothetical protein